MNQCPYDLILPAKPRAGLVVSSPHSGRDYLSDFVEQSPLSAQALRSSEDAFVDQLWADAPSLGVPLLAARAPRAYVDLNRAAEDLDPALIEGLKRGAFNPRVASGLGVIPRVVAAGRVIHPGRISQAQASERLATYWHPWHNALRELINAQSRRFQEVLLLDCHSMPHEAVSALESPPNVVLGDRHGAACAPSLMAQVEEAFRAEGFVTARNTPFAGAYIAQTYGRPQFGTHAIQVEIDRSLYMDEATLTPNSQFGEVRARLSRVTERILGTLRQGGAGEALVAE